MALLRKNESHSKEEALQKLVDVVLDPLARKARPKFGFRYRIGLWRVALRKQLQKHSVMTICVLVGLILTAASTFLVQRGGEAANASAVNTASTGSQGYSGSGSAAESPGYDRVTDSHVGRRGTTVSTVLLGPVTDEVGILSVSKDLIERVVDGIYEQRSDVATGRFLRDFQRQWFLLVDVNSSRLQPARRAKKWMQVRGPYNISEDSLRQQTEYSKENWKQAVEAIIRVVDENDVWKLEHIRVY